MNAPGRISWLAWWQLLRLSNVFTAVSNIVAGHALAQRGTVVPSQLLLLAASSALLYSAGMVLNDVCDSELDAKERPERPIPSGRVTRRAARTLGIVLIILGWSAAAVASALADHWQSLIIALALLLTILLYDTLAKSIVIGPWVMACCRGLNILLGGSSTDFGETDASLWFYAATIFLFTTGLTYIARKEVDASCVKELTIGATLVLASLGLFALMPALLSESRLPWGGWILVWCGTAAFSAPAILRVCRHPVPEQVRSTVGTLIQLFIVLDAAATGLAVGAGAALLVLLLLLPAWTISLWTPPS